MRGVIRDPSRNTFMKEIKASGLGGAELVAMHMKTQGQYMARQLSFANASFTVRS